MSKFSTAFNEISAFAIAHPRAVGAGGGALAGGILSGKDHRVSGSVVGGLTGGILGHYMSGGGGGPKAMGRLGVGARGDSGNVRGLLGNGSGGVFKPFGLLGNG